MPIRNTSYIVFMWGVSQLAKVIFLSRTDWTRQPKKNATFLNYNDADRIKKKSVKIDFDSRVRWPNSLIAARKTHSHSYCYGPIGAKIKDLTYGGEVYLDRYIQYTLTKMTVESFLYVIWRFVSFSPARITRKNNILS